MKRSRMYVAPLMVGALLVMPSGLMAEEPENGFSARVIAFTGGFTSTLVKIWKEGAWSDFGNVPEGGVWSISGTSENDLWVGVVHGFAHNYQLYHWDGIDWELQDLPQQKSEINQMVVVHSFSRDSVIADGVGGLTGQSRVWHFDGTHWTLLCSPPWSGAQQGTMLALAPDLIYFAGNGWWDAPGLFRWAGFQLVQEELANLPGANDNPPYIFQYSGLGWDGTDLWLLDAGWGGGGEPAYLRKGLFGSPWTLVQELGPDAGYAHSYSTYSKKSMVMDERGILSVTAMGFFGPTDVVLQGDPNLNRDEINPGAGATNPGSGEKAAAEGYYLMTNNHRGNWYDPDVGVWTVPDDGGWGGNAAGAHIISLVIFDNGFESGDTSEWSVTVP